LVKRDEKLKNQALELENNLQELRKTQEMLIQSAKLASLGRLTSDMAHEINNPLMIISGNAQLALDEQDHAEIRKHLNIIIGECARAKDIITRLLRFSKPSRVQLKKTDIAAHIDGIVAMIEHQFTLQNITFRRDYSDGLEPVPIDGQQVHEVIINLLNNAREAMPTGGIITLRTYKDGDMLCVEVQDTGAGLPDEVIANFPEPFYTTKEKGTGLGLPVCYGIMKAHGGDMKLASEPGRGTTVTLRFPLHPQGE